MLAAKGARVEKKKRQKEQNNKELWDDDNAAKVVKYNPSNSKILSCS
jgi:hypothetical protein